MNVSSYKHQWYLQNRDRILKLRHEYHKTNKETIHKRASLYYQKHAEEIKLKTRKWKLANPDRVLASRKRCRSKDLERGVARRKLKSYKEYINEYTRKRKGRDPQYKLSILLRCRINKLLRGKDKVGSAVRELGATLDVVIQHLESKFHDRSTGEKMTWDKWSPTGWHIDHVKPLKDFDLTDLNQFKEACHYTNLQPLWYEDNLAKRYLT